MTYTVAIGSGHTDIMVVDAHPEHYAQLAAAHSSRGMLFQFATSASDALRLWRTAAPAGKETGHRGLLGAIKSALPRGGRRSVDLFVRLRYAPHARRPPPRGYPATRCGG